VSPKSPPTLIIQGADDHTVPPSQSEALASALTAAGVPNTLLLVPGAGHEAELGHGLVFNGHSYLSTVLDFLNANLKR
ncbi:MAG TPA: alpha/beta fold hydrolase, partial [Isosphaeraceae bacterium]|jgi:fermentation-respiration switch protein FrsA (DUF1100 family)|nr:alpha/beta fold hydrolase [Isosphaeraceae bacterium]